MQEFTEKDCMGQKREVSIQNWVVILPSKVLPEHYIRAAFFSVRISRKQKIPDIPLPIWFYLLGGMALPLEQGCGCVSSGQNCCEKERPQPPRSVHLRRIYMDMLNILDAAVFCRMDAMRQGYGRKSRGSMELCNDAEGLPVSDLICDRMILPYWKC